MIGLIARLARDDRGTALLEGTLVVPVLLALIGGVVEFSHFFYQQHKMTTGVRDAARYLSRFDNATYGSRTTDAQNLATTGSFVPGAPLRVTGWTTIAVAPTNISNDDGAGNRLYRSACATIRVITVTSNVTYTPIMFPGGGYLAYFGFNPPTLRASHSERQLPDRMPTGC
jgi:Flp pilus assembly protein TadG